MSNPIIIHSFPLSGHAHRVELLANLAGIKHSVNNINLPDGEQVDEHGFITLLGR